MPATHHSLATTLTTRPTNVKAQPGAGTPGATTHPGHTAVATPTTQTDNDYFASLSLAHQMMWRILGVFIFIGHFIYVSLRTPSALCANV
ncbi:hypothetical protein DAEQUDRAFT_721872 [Daedalea quercina L-15889]|uniref:Uncharacterized protein n=1 Tax=Daedalea quercina L-15889 TaxID=1314783 RepID=A0A165TDG4_9APHY|nr:hypothetical protein DAEQUDRAFT_721872 [Daedalea quercina L-15889]